MSSAFATKARQKALGNSFHLSGNTQTYYTSPLHILGMAPFVALESGLTTATSADTAAEGSALFKINDTDRFLLSVGHQDESVQSQRKFINSFAGVTDYKSQQNPAEIFYAHKIDDQSAWSMGMYYSNFKDKIGSEKESTAGLRLSASHGDFNWKTSIGLINNSINTVGDEFMNEGYVNLGLRYKSGELRYGFDITTWSVKQTLAGAADANIHHTYQNMNLKVVHALKADGIDYFYGATLDQIQVKNRLTDKSFNRLSLPLIMGAEAKATDFLVVRGSIIQTALLAKSEDEVGYPTGSVTGAANAVTDFAAEANNTVVSAGLGLVFNKIQIDGTLAGLTGSAATQNIDANKFMGQVGLVYKY